MGFLIMATERGFPNHLCKEVNNLLLCVDRWRVHSFYHSARHIGSNALFTPSTNSLNSWVNLFAFKTQEFAKKERKIWFIGSPVYKTPTAMIVRACCLWRQVTTKKFFLSIPSGVIGFGNLRLTTGATQKSFSSFASGLNGALKISDWSRRQLVDWLWGIDKIVVLRWLIW